ncbi:molybdopterin molybdotransferase MoeA [Sphingomonas colocasiae]|uniref:Molybdopterin molybdenumtransferase n=1 Tax=Sphingomonas colocasiae TaxID=1848973 RepID=A0ABS7PNS5_9SPHN|nr:molybdopterin molybdotransferase MoeA [Sphingomonas colocasiae]MBY8822970.1 molybdopterin molybdotransferase MoeA [Sphingomonas colocasiae]
MSALLPVADAQVRLLALAMPLPAETLPLGETAGRYLAEDCTATRGQPAADLSAMDGYAIAFAGMPGPWHVTGESVPGTLPDRMIARGEAMRIFTGAPLPAGTDTILIQEEAARDGDTLTLTGEGPRRLGQHVRVADGDFAERQRLVARGALLTAARIGLAAMGGHGKLTVGRRPRVALISTGDELVPPGDPISGVQLPASNAIMLRAMLEPISAIVDDHGIVRDDFDTLAAAFDAAREADIIVTSGGASVGDHDLVRPVLDAIGGTLDFWKIAMKPGKPLLAGKLGDAIVLGLPGNPVSTFVTGTLFLLPLVRALQGAADPLPPTHRVKLGAPLPACGGRAEYLRGLWADGEVIQANEQDSAAMVSLASANALIVRSAGAPAAEAGEMAEIVALG